MPKFRPPRGGGQRGGNGGAGGGLQGSSPYHPYYTSSNMANSSQSSTNPNLDLFSNAAELNPELDEDDEGDDADTSFDASKRRALFSKELRCMLFGYGDDENPYTESVEFLEDLVIEFIQDMTRKAMEIGRPGRVQVEDIIFLVRKHPKMYARVKELLTMNEELKKARKAFDEIKYVQGSN